MKTKVTLENRLDQVTRRMAVLETQKEKLKVEMVGDKKKEEAANAGWTELEGYVQTSEASACFPLYR